MTEIPEANLNIDEDREIAKQSQKHFSKIGGGLFLGTLIIFGVQYLASYIQVIFFPESIGNYDITLFVSSFSMYLIGMPFLVLFLRKIPKTTIARRKMGIGKCVAAFFMSYALMYITNMFGILITVILELVKGDIISNPLQEVVMEISPLTALILMVICAPIVEEYVFRKIIVDRTVRYGEKTAIFLSGIIFGLFHGNLNQFMYAFGLGVFFAFVYVKTGKLIYSILLHCLINFMGSIPGMVMLKSDFFTQMENVSALDTEEMMALMAEYLPQIMCWFAYMIVILAFVVTGIVLWAVNFKKMKCVAGEVTIPKGQRFKTVILNVGMILYCLFWIVQIIIQIMG